MTDLFEREVRDAFAARVDAVAPLIIERLDTAGLKPRRRRIGMLRRIGAAGALLAAAVTAVVVALTAGTPVAFAGWTAIPTAAGSTAVAVARAACGHVPAGAVLVSEARGPYTAIVFLRNGRPWQCVVKGPRAVVDLSTPYALSAYAKVPAGKVMVPFVSRRVFGNTNRRLKQSAGTWSGDRVLALMTGPGSVSVALGIAGADVTGVTLALKSGERVHATVEHGWYVAWWPGAAKPGGAETTRITVTTSAGTRSSRLPATAGTGPYLLDAKGCFPGDPCSVLVPLGLSPGIAASVRRHFAIFTTTAPVNWSTEPRYMRSLIDNPSADFAAGSHSTIGEVQMQNGVSYGLDRAQTREIKLTANDSLWIIPGTEGYCTELVQLHAGPLGGNVSEDSCGPNEQLLHDGYIQATAGGPAPYTIGGFVPNANSTVTIHLKTGAARTVRVHDNTFLAHLQTAPATVTLKTATGSTITERVHPSP